MNTFSIDMLRLETSVSKQDFEYFHHKVLEVNPHVNFYIQRGFSEYRNNYQVSEHLSNKNVFDKTDCVNKFWFAYQHNSEHLSDNPLHKFKLVLEFNPNKCDIDGILLKLLRSFFFNLNRVFIKSCDVAFDIPIHIENFIFDKKLKRYTCDISQGDGRTFYFGSPGSDGRVKVYNKGAEQGVEYDWTRWEMSIKFKETTAGSVLFERFDFAFNPPEVFYFKDLNLDDFDVKMKCYIYSIQNGFVKLDDFPRKIREKIKTQLATVSSVKVIDVNNKQDVYNTILSYFKCFVKTYDNNFTDFEEKKAKMNDVLTYFETIEGERLQGEQLRF